MYLPSGCSRSKLQHCQGRSSLARAERSAGGSAPKQAPAGHAAQVPYSGIGALVGLFAAPDEPEYEPQPDAPRPVSPRRFRNPELAAQARVDIESRAEKCAAARASRGLHCVYKEIAALIYFFWQ